MSQIKRSKPSDIRAKKRLKISGPSKTPDDSISKSAGNKAKSWKLAKLDTLDWREVGMPDVLDDVEGFMGLEEVEDVQVLNDRGMVQYRVRVSRGGNISRSAKRRLN